MLRTVLSGKIHRATVTQANLDYVGSITIDEHLVEAAGFVAGEKVHVVDVTNGARLETYVIVGAGGSGVVCINGAAAHLVQEGDLIIILSYAMADESELAAHQPRIIHVDETNRIVGIGSDPSEPIPGAAVGIA